MLLSRGAGIKSSQVLSLASFLIFFSGIEPVLPGCEFSDHLDALLVNATGVSYLNREPSAFTRNSRNKRVNSGS
jgi:hypothetical protein